MMLCSRVSHTNTQWTEHKSPRFGVTNNKEKKAEIPILSQITQETETEIDGKSYYSLKLFLFCSI